jgi:hypothetical protein
LFQFFRFFADHFSEPISDGVTAHHMPLFVKRPFEI